MQLLRPKAGRNATVYGGEKKRRSATRARAGTAWKERSTEIGSGGCQEGSTSFGSI